MDAHHAPMAGTRRRRVLAAATLCLCTPAAAHAHSGVAPAPHDLWQSWSAEPAVLLGLAVGGWAYGRGVRVLWRRTGAGRGVSRAQLSCYVGGLLAVALALLSPVDRVGAALFSVHMVQHLLLMMAAAPLIVLGEPLLPLLWAMRIDARRIVGRRWHAARRLRGLWRLLRLPIVAWSLHVIALWVWHIPALYDRAVRDEWVHVVEHLSFFASALLFWWVLLDRRARRRLGAGAAIFYLFTAALQSTLLGAGLTLARRPLYSAHWGTTTAWGLSPLEDQQLAGLIMWVPAGVIYLAALAPMLVRMLRVAPTGGRPLTARRSAAPHSS
jgi:putative membrane protein